MSEENGAKQCADEVRDERLSPSCSSFELQDPHDPVISRLATQHFRLADDYLQGEILAGQDAYETLEDLNKLTMTKYEDITKVVANLTKIIDNQKEHYEDQIKPLLMSIDALDSQMAILEKRSYHLDFYIKSLTDMFKEYQTPNS